MRKILDNKKGGFIDVFLFLIIAVIITFIGVVSIYSATQIKSKMDTTFFNKSQIVNYTTIVDKHMGNIQVSYSVLEWVSFFLIIGMIIAIIIGNTMVEPKPAYFVIYIIIIIIAVIVAAGISNAYETVRNNTLLTSTFDGFSGANYILDKLPIWIAGISIIGGVIMFIRMERVIGQGF